MVPEILCGFSMMLSGINSYWFPTAVSPFPIGSLLLSPFPIGSLLLRRRFLLVPYHGGRGLYWSPIAVMKYYINALLMILLGPILVRFGPKSSVFCVC